MTVKDRANISELQWKDVRLEVAKLNPELAEIIDKIDPGPECTLFKASYPFGGEILKNGDLYIPNSQGVLTCFNSPQISNHVRDKLNYNLGSNPVSFILKNTAEFFIIRENNTIPFYGLMTPGKIFGFWRVLNPGISQHPIFIWDMSAGARSIFMLPKISETGKYNKLSRAFQLRSEKPNTLLDHWKLFKEIANHPDFGEAWTAEILFFSKEWFDRLNDKEWSAFKMYLFEKAWAGTEFFRNQFIWSVVFSLIQQGRNIKPNPYIADVVRHLLAMGIGALPGFAPAIDDSAGPILRLQEVFNKIYLLTDYAPIIMQPYFFNLEDPRPIYYSLQYPNTIEFSPKARESSTKISDLYQIKSLLSKYLEDIFSNTLKVSGTMLYDLYEKVQYDFFHTDVEKYSGIRLSKEIPKEDSTFLQVPEGMSHDFPANSAFVRGCIRVAAKSK